MKGPNLLITLWPLFFFFLSASACLGQRTVETVLEALLVPVHCWFPLACGLLASVVRKLHI